jgi:hypothetical protein
MYGFLFLLCPKKDRFFWRGGLCGLLDELIVSRVQPSTILISLDDQGIFANLNPLKRIVLQRFKEQLEIVF